MNYRTLLYLVATIVCTQALHGMQGSHGNEIVHEFLKRKAQIMAENELQEIALSNQFAQLTLKNRQRINAPSGKPDNAAPDQQNSRKRYKKEDDTIVEEDTNQND